MTNSEFKAQIAEWKALIEGANIRLPGNRPVPDKFFHVFLGIGSSTFRKMINGQDSMRVVQHYTARTVHFINQLAPEVFLREVQSTIPEYMKLYHSNQKQSEKDR
ncbi:hypothetical protein ACNO5E_21300 [Vibrio parahaemolyticus]|uniref:hypothetical protein n=1 Tax=Vibrio parahaemolyticus TaxID=670 RepID=UPI0008136D8C|nr:hypothetical protein [Vibrio parahaemolyticus]OCP68368.1 hypothetical protein AKH08_16270 [Vibrio parahaemolyticus]